MPTICPLSELGSCSMLHTRVCCSVACKYSIKTPCSTTVLEKHLGASLEFYESKFSFLVQYKNKQTNSVALSPRANYTD
jgi:hypothetical protein